MTSPLLSSKPVRTTEDDLFGRDPFARQIAGLIAQLDGPEPPVLGIVGDWGSGKTSLLRLVEHHVERSDRDVVAVWFNPWAHASMGRGAIQSALLSQVAGSVVRGRGRIAGRKLRGLLKRYGAATVRSARYLPGAGNAGAAASDIASSALSNLSENHEKLIGEMTSEGRRVLVLVDDVDRLTGVELLELFAAMRVVADLPYVQYLVAYDSGYVAAALSATTHVDGNQFVEKIIEIPIPVPALTFTHISRHVFQQIEEILNSRGLSTTFLRELAAAQIEAIFRTTLSTPRDLVRYLSRIRTLAPSAYDAELDSVDFLSNEFLAVFYPEIHQALIGNQSAALFDWGWYEHLAMGATSLDSRDIEKSLTERAVQTFEPIIDGMTAPERRSVLGALHACLPRLAEALGGPPRGGARLEQERRMSDPAYFGRYFSYTAWHGDIPDSVVTERWRRVLDGQPFDEVFGDLIEDRRVDLLMDKLVKAVEHEPPDASSGKRIISEMSRLLTEGQPLAGRYIDHEAWGRQTSLSTVGAQILRCAGGREQALALVGSLDDWLFAYDVWMAWFGMSDLGQVEANEAYAEIGPHVASRLAEPGELLRFRQYPELLINPARKAAAADDFPARAQWTSEIENDPELIEVVLRILRNVQRGDGFVDYLGRFVDLPTAKSAISQLSAPSALAQEMTHLLSN